MISTPFDYPAGRDTDAHLARLLGQPGTPRRYTFVDRDALLALDEYCRKHKAGWTIARFSPLNHTHQPNPAYYCQIKMGDLLYPPGPRVLSAQADTVPLAITRTLLAIIQYQNK